MCARKLASRSEPRPSFHTSLNHRLIKTMFSATGISTFLIEDANGTVIPPVRRGDSFLPIDSLSGKVDVDPFYLQCGGSQKTVDTRHDAVRGTLREQHLEARTLHS